MPSLAVILRTDQTRSDGLFTVAFRLTINRKTKYKSAGYAVDKTQFKTGLTNWIRKHPDAELMNRALEERRSAITANLMEAQAGRFPLDHEAIFTGKTDVKGATLGSILLKRAAYYEKKQDKRWYFHMLELKRETIECWGTDMPLNQITDEHVRDLVLHFSQVRENNANTIADKIGRLRSIFRAEIKSGRVSIVNPFELVTVSRQPVEKTKLTWEDIKKIESLELSGQTCAARDMFLFAFYMHGMRFENCLRFKKEDAHGLISYRMNKGKKIREISVAPQLEGIISKYLNQNPASPFLFPFLTKEPVDKWKWVEQKGSWNTLLNKHLKYVAIACGIDKKISYHIARHTFASLLKKFQAGKGESNIYLIQKALGHSDIKTTQMYLESLDDDSVNEQVGRMFDRDNGKQKPR